jgi:hypothetical protein
VIRACEHCGNPDKSLWRTECRYKGLYPSHRAFVLSTFDPPCACDQFDEDMRDIGRCQNILAICITLCVGAVIALIWLALKR